ncbi:DinB family protein [Streptomyces sp. A7024]|uniref:DinB family protein n=1 Tax=Streptomyces coryli TaxID=1128680 RepID=A0A6G4TS53_9ACTN|nr:DinB family protein [Streptomyces coryli]NGN62380.1 DinB family protein [Streptomyces coryli]
MATNADMLVDHFGRILEEVDAAVAGLGPAELEARLDDEANSIAWLVWHLTRVQDDHIAEVAGLEQVWTAKGWHEKFGLPFEPAETGYGHSAEEVAAVRGVTAKQLAGYHRAVHDQTVAYVRGLSDEDLDRVIDKNWTPPVTLGVRLVSVIGDDLEHVGQAAFVRGVVERRKG